MLILKRFRKFHYTIGTKRFFNIAFSRTCFVAGIYICICRKNLINLMFIDEIQINDLLRIGELFLIEFLIIITIFDTGDID